jgi:hypothetical protein
MRLQTGEAIQQILLVAQEFQQLVVLEGDLHVPLDGVHMIFEVTSVQQ